MPVTGFLVLVSCQQQFTSQPCKNTKKWQLGGHHVKIPKNGNWEDMAEWDVAARSV
jgi:hypothetical protein